MRKFCVVVAFVVLFASCGSKGNDLDAIKKRGEVVLYTDANWPPFEYIGADGAVVGVDIDIANAIAAEIGVPLKITNAAFDNFSVALQTEQADMAISAINITEERRESLDFSIPYTEGSQFIIKHESAVGIKTLDDLSGRSIGVQIGTIGYFMVDENINNGTLKGSSVKAFRSVQEAVLALNKGDLVAVVCDERLARNVVSVNTGLDCIEARLASGKLDSLEYAAAVKKGNVSLVEAINTAIKKMMDSGAIAASFESHSEASAVQ
jgi:polar amino acid transport system substrate-binding protein